MKQERTFPEISPFEAANSRLGHGEPERAVWFVGLEYADAPGTAEEALREYERDHEPETGAAVARPRGEPDFSGLGRKGLAIRLLTSRILRAVSKDADAHGHHHRWFMKHHLWWPGSETFQANLYPLCRPRHDSRWPESFRTEFGLAGWQDYERRVREQRFPLLRRYWAESERKAVICFGMGEWPRFTEAFQVTSEARELVPGRVMVHRDERVVLTPFFDFRYFSYADADAVGEYLRSELKVVIP